MTFLSLENGIEAGLPWLAADVGLAGVTALSWYWLGRRHSLDSISLALGIGGLALPGAIAVLAGYLVNHDAYQLRAADGQIAACAAGSALACQILGGEAARVSALRRACDGDEASACDELGKVVEKSHPIKAAQLYQHACSLANAQACCDLSHMFQRSSSPRDMTDAQLWRGRARAIDARACP